MLIMLSSGYGAAAILTIALMWLTAWPLWSGVVIFWFGGAAITLSIAMFRTEVPSDVSAARRSVGTRRSALIARTR